MTSPAILQAISTPTPRLNTGTRTEPAEQRLDLLRRPIRHAAQPPDQQLEQRAGQAMRPGAGRPVGVEAKAQVLLDKFHQHLAEAFLHDLPGAPPEQRPEHLLLLMHMGDQSPQEGERLGHGGPRLRS